ILFFFSSRRRHTIFSRDWSSDVCSSDLFYELTLSGGEPHGGGDASPLPGAVQALDVGHEQEQQEAVVVGEARRVVASDQQAQGRSEERRVGKECKDGGTQQH